MKTAGVIALTLGLALGVAEAQPQEQGRSPAIENGSKVQLEYTLKDDGGKVLDSNRGQEPLMYTQGQQQIIPGLEKALNGMRAGDEKKVTVKPADAYGEVDPRALTEVPKDMLPPDALTVGTELVAQSQGGGRRIVRVKEVKEKTVVIDLNHPLAGKTLFFDVKVLGVEPPKK
ncbi:MAG: peptidylprolyl isomerase [Candidatus Rokubacteria bacterium]|nr:peptidylprolyl isomerase [Candidatus Rokubacteria bacterium]MBI2544736.1 peptidylprolyl isomerase [Candidatus Rokubacteria bacterium]MBI2552848.1 peptidylprolyl isomerase [Candidatus Rokubacteria bacterium]